MERHTAIEIASKYPREVESCIFKENLVTSFDDTETISKRIQKGHITEGTPIISE